MTTPSAAAHATSFTPPAGVRGRFVWQELIADDADAAVAFYTGLLGWTAAPFEGSEPPYTLFLREGTPVAGVMAMTADMRSHGTRPYWMPYMGSDDVDASVADAKRAGSTVYLGPIDMPTVGRVSVLADPQGALFGLYRPSSEATPVRAPEVGEFSWFELATPDDVAARDFYASLLGWSVIEEHQMAPEWLYRIFARADGIPLGGIVAKRGPLADAPTQWGVFVKVADVAAACDTVRRLGGQVLREPHPVPGGDLIAMVADPQGATFSLHQAAGA